MIDQIKEIILFNREFPHPEKKVREDFNALIDYIERLEEIIKENEKYDEQRR